MACPVTVRNSRLLSRAALACLCAASVLFSSTTATSAGEQQSATAESEDAAVRVMTFNIRYNNRRDGENAWPNRKDIVAGIIRDNKTDIVGLQEALPEQVRDLETRLDEFAWYGVGRNDAKVENNNSGETCSIFYRKDRFERLDAGTFWLAQDPNKVGNKSWDAALPRICSWVKLQDARSGGIVFAFNTHFDHVGEEARQESAKLLVREIPRIAGEHAFVLTGDFNADPNSEPYAVLSGKKQADDEEPTAFRDAVKISEQTPNGPDSTWNGFREVVPGRRIDYVFLPSGRGSVRSLATLDQTYEGRFPSDHLPVIAEVMFAND